MSNRQPISTFLGIAAAVVLVANSHAATIFVNGPCGNDAWSGLSDVCIAPDGPKATIQEGIDAAVNGDEVVVAPGGFAAGGFYGRIDFLGKAITVRSSDPNDAGVVLDTIIAGDGSGPVVTCKMGEGSDTVLSGFVIFSNNSAGGMSNIGSSPTVTNCTFQGNTANDGGGMHNDNSSPTVTNCSFIGNTSTQLGGGMANFNGSSPTVTNCSFIGNTAGATGGGMFNDGGSNPTVTNTGFCDSTPFAAIVGTFTDGGGNSLLVCPPQISAPNPCPTDINGDGVTNVLDLIDLLLAFGQACP